MENTGGTSKASPVDSSRERGGGLRMRNCCGTSFGLSRVTMKLGASGSRIVETRS
jgi:hypothetical protein